MTSLLFFSSSAIFLLISVIYFVPRTMALFNVTQGGFFNGKPKFFYWLFVFVFAFLGLFCQWLDPQSKTIFSLIGALLLAFYLSFLYALILVDLLKLIVFLFTKNKKSPIILQFLFPLLGLLLFIIGLFLILSPRLTYYQVEVQKNTSLREDGALRIVQVGDLNLNRNTSVDSVRLMVDKINQLSPDYIVMTGNIIHSDLDSFVKLGFSKALLDLNAHYGKFVVLGENEHRLVTSDETASGNLDLINTYKDAGLTVLQNEIFGDSATGIYFVGMDDTLSTDRIEIQNALPIIERDIAKKGYERDEISIIVLDHRPNDIAINEISGVDLMFSGHTMGGQLFPLDLICKMQYKNSVGIYQNTQTHFTSIVTSGFGFLGPMMRMMTRSEIVVVDIEFVQYLPEIALPDE